MTIPATVLKVLDDWQVNYKLADDEDTFQLMQGNPMTSYSSKLARVVFLKDSIGQVQVVIPSNRILDLNRLSQQCGRQFNALKPDELTKLKAKFGIEDFPALPQVTQIDSMVDEHLLTETELFITSGDSHEWITLPMDGFKTLTTSSTIGDFTVALPTPCYEQSPTQDLDDVHAAIKQFTPLRIKQRLEETLDLPPLPETARKIIELRVDPNADTTELSNVVEMDPGMAAQVVSWARSPYYGVKGEIKSVEDAVIRVLGFDLVINLALGLALGRTLSVPKEGPNGYTPFWQQAVMTAALMGELARLMPAKVRPNRGTAYLCGLLHNFGYLILGHVFPPQFALVNRHIEANPHINRSLLEKYLMGLSREQVSSLLMQQWRMPEEVVIALRSQHNPSYEGESSAYANLLYVATRSLRSRGFGDGAWEEPHDEVFERLGINADSVHNVTESLLEKADDLNELVQMLNK
ncbi:MAG: HD-like signal output (HDOD) protein/prolyl-tRNA editing enzyme YbaK/EbsC (Cys-tRNA(Pro) deacylase) [Oleispira sp.]|jgi:HD-like signal output (HDOD) protein/prolyl-tRNA editing enzyme YbaK/EbsC (Cys-tRNA(Pro) deacylase)